MNIGSSYIRRWTLILSVSFLREIVHGQKIYLNLSGSGKKWGYNVSEAGLTNVSIPLLREWIRVDSVALTGMNLKVIQVDQTL